MVPPAEATLPVVFGDGMAGRMGVQLHAQAPSRGAAVWARTSLLTPLTPSGHEAETGRNASFEAGQSGSRGPANTPSRTKGVDAIAHTNWESAVRQITALPLPGQRPFVQVGK